MTRYPGRCPIHRSDVGGVDPERLQDGCGANPKATTEIRETAEKLFDPNVHVVS